MRVPTYLQFDLICYLQLDFIVIFVIPVRKRANVNVQHPSAHTGEFQRRFSLLMYFYSQKGICESRPSGVLVSLVNFKIIVKLCLSTKVMSLQIMSS